MISAEEFLSILEMKNLVPPEAIVRLREELARSKKSLPAAVIARQLADFGYISRSEAQHLLDAAEIAKAKVLHEKVAHEKPHHEQPAHGTPAHEKPHHDRPADDKAHPKGVHEQVIHVTIQVESPETTPAKPVPAGHRPEHHKKDEPSSELGLAPLDSVDLRHGHLTGSAVPAKKPEPEKPDPARVPPATSADPAAVTPVLPNLMEEELPSLPVVDAAEPAEAGPTEPRPIKPGDIHLSSLIRREVVDAAKSATGGPRNVRRKKSRRGWRAILSFDFQNVNKEELLRSPLVPMGGAILLALVVLLAVAVWSSNRQRAAQSFEEAQAEFAVKAYANAITKYTLFIDQFSSHEHVGIAIVRRGICQLQHAVQVSPRWVEVLNLAKQVIEEISAETEYSEAQQTLAEVLPAIAAGLAADARKITDPEAVIKATARVQETLDMVRLHVPKSMQNVVQRADIEYLMAMSLREVERDKELNQSLVKIRQAVQERRTSDAHRLRNRLLGAFPELAENPYLRDLMSAVADADRQTVVKHVKPRKAETVEAVSPASAEVAMVRRAAPPGVAPATSHPVLVLADGAVYAVQAATGQVLWRRFVGYDFSGRNLPCPPFPVSDQPGGDWILVDSIPGEVLRVEAATGRLRWRHPLGETFEAHPVIVGDHLLVGTPSGRLVTIDLASGDSPGHVQLPQPLRVAAAFDPVRSLIFQPADHANLYVLSRDGQCKRGIFLGHRAGSITATPVVLGRFIILVINDGIDDSTLWVFSTGRDDTSPVRPIQQIALQGHVDVPPAVFGSRMLVASDTGALYLCSVSGPGSENPVTVIGKQEPIGPEHLIRFPLLTSDRILCGGDGLASYENNALRSRLRVQTPCQEGTVLTQRISAAGNCILCVCRKGNLPGTRVFAVDPATSKTLWETHLAAPLAGEVRVDPDGKTVLAATSSGAVFQIELASLQGRQVLDRPLAAIPFRRAEPPLERMIAFADGHLAASFGPRSRQIAWIDPAGSDKEFHEVRLPDAAVAMPVPWAGGVLVPASGGWVHLMDLKGGGKLAEPFLCGHPEEDRITWRQPACSHEHAVIADNRTGLYVLGIKNNPRSYLMALAQRSLPAPLAGPPALLDNVVYVTDTKSQLAAYAVPGLIPGKTWPLAGHCVWGPCVVGRCVLAATDRMRLYCFDAAQKLLWESPLEYGPLAGPPCLVGESYVLAATSGIVWRLDAASGQKRGKLDLGQPLGTGPVSSGEFVLVGTHDGVLLQCKEP